MKQQLLKNIDKKTSNSKDILSKNEKIKIENRENKVSNLQHNNVNENNLEIYSNIEDILFLKQLTNDSYSDYNWIENTFTVFKSLDDNIYLIYSNKNKAIICYNIIDNKKLIEIKNAHNKYITSFRYLLDKINNRDLIISISAFGNDIKLWDIKNWECIIGIEKVYKNGTIVSACFLTDNNNNYIISSNDTFNNCGPIKVFDFNGKEIKEINNSNNLTCFIDTYYDQKLSKNYIITGNYKFCQSYDFNKNIIYHKYCDNDNSSHSSLIIINNNDIIKLIDSSRDGNIKIWNFHSGLLLSRIKVSNCYIVGICLWNIDNLFVGSVNKIILVDLNNEKILYSIILHKKQVLTIKKISHPKFGDCLISQGEGDDQIKLWINKN